MGAVNSHSHHIVVVRAGLHRADPTQEAQVAVAALQASAQGEGCPGMNTTYTVKHIQKGPPLFSQCRGAERRL